MSKIGLVHLNDVKHTSDEIRLRKRFSVHMPHAFYICVAELVKIAKLREVSTFQKQTQAARPSRVLVEPGLRKQKKLSVPQLHCALHSRCEPLLEMPASL
jgi:hypothetical protein